MDTLVKTFEGLISAFVGVISTGIELVKYYSLNWGQLIVYGGLIFVLAKMLKVKVSVSK